MDYDSNVERCLAQVAAARKPSLRRYWKASLAYWLAREAGESGQAEYEAARAIHRENEASWARRRGSRHNAQQR